MLRKTLLYCGILAPVLYVITTIVGASLLNDYSDLVNAIAMLISNSAFNRAILELIFKIYNVLLLAFAIGGYLVLKNAPRPCRIAMGALIAVQILSFSWGFFPMDPISTAVTFTGTMHNILGGIVALATIIMPALIGWGLRNTDGFQAYSKYSFVTSTIILLSGLTAVILARQGVQLSDLFERITIGSYAVWIFVTALNLLKTSALEQIEPGRIT